METKFRCQFEIWNYTLFIFIIIFFYLGDALRKIAHHFEWVFYKYTTLSKIIALVLMISFVFIYWKNYINQKKLVLYILILIGIYVLGQFFLIGLDRIENFTQNLEFLGKYLYFPIFCVVFYPLIGKGDYLNKALVVFEVIFFINVFFIFYGFLTGSDLFKTYYYGSRLGYNGFFGKSGQTSYYFIILLFYYYRRLMINFNKLDLIKLSILILSSFLVGTKKIFFFIPVFLIYHLLTSKLTRKKVLVFIGIAGSIFTILFYEKLKVFAIEIFRLFYKIYEENGFLSSLTSYRNDKLVETFKSYVGPHWSLSNYFIGGGSFQDYLYISGMDLIDLYLFFGVVGLCIYAIIYRRFLRFDFKDSFNILFVVTIFTMAFISGGFFYEPSVNLLFFLIVPILSKLKISNKVCY